MTPEQIDLVFGRGRLKMATGEHVEVYREAVIPGERRRYTKRFLDTGDADFGQWTEREWRILARLIGHGIRCVPDVVQFDSGAMGGMRLVQTYDAGVTVDQWATLLPVSRDGTLHRHVFEESAHWWALAHYCLAALDEIHALHVVHLDIKGDNICIPYGPANFDPELQDLRFYPMFEKLALIDFAFSLVSRENLATPLPIGWQKDYDYQSPRLLRALEAGRGGDVQPTRDLDWRCDLYSLAAMLKRYLPDRDRACSSAGETGWTPERYESARSLIFRLRECHDRDFSHWRPHQQLMDIAAAQLQASDLAASFDRGWTLAPHATGAGTATPITPITPITRIVPSLQAAEPLRIPSDLGRTAVTAIDDAPRASAPQRRLWQPRLLIPALGTLAALAMPAFVGDPSHPLADRAREALAAIGSMLDASPPDHATMQSSTTESTPAPPSESANEPAPRQEVAKQIEKPAPATTSANSDAPRAPSASVAQGSAPKQKAAAAAPRAKAAVAANRASPAPHSSSGAKAPPLHPLPSLASIEALPKQQRVHPTPPGAATPRSGTRPTPAAQRPEVTPAEVQSAKVAPTTPTPQAGAQSIAAATEEARVEQKPTPVDRPEAKPPAVNQPGAAQPPAAREDRRPPAAASNQLARVAPEAQPSDPIAALWKLLTGSRQPPAPIEERRAQSPERSAAVAAAPSTQTLIDDSRAPRSGVLSSPAPAAAPPAPTVEPRVWRASQTQDSYATQGRRVLADIVPRIAARAEPDVTRVLWIADSAYQPAQERSVVAGIAVTWPSESLLLPPGINLAPVLARRLHDDARQALAVGRDPADAVNLEMQAFGADPRDPDIAGYLAFLHLKTRPVQAERARQLALYAIAVSASRRATRPDDWNTLAIASALAGRQADATRSLFVAIALTRDPGRSCQAALGVYTSFGENLRGPAEAALYRIHAQGRGYESPYCTWPPNWGAGTRSLERLSLDGRTG